MKSIAIGRDLDNDIVIDSNRVSRKHALLIINSKDDIVLKDHSRNGTVVNGELLHNDAKTVRYGEVIKMAGEFSLDWSQVDRHMDPKTSIFISIKKEKGGAIRQFFDGLFNFTQVVKHFKFLFFLIFSSSRSTIEIIEGTKKPEVKPFKYMSFGFTIMVLTQATDSLWGDERLEFVSDWLVLFFSVVFLFVYLSITYKIFKDVSIRKDRTFGDFLVLSALVGGSNWTLYGIAEVMVVLNQPLGGLAYLISATTVFIYSIKVYRSFWEMSYFNIFLYSFMVLLLIIIVIFSIFFLLGIN